MSPGSASSTRTGRGTPLGELLIDAGSIGPEQLAKALAEQNQNYDLLGRILIRQGTCNGADVLGALQKQFRITSVDIGRVPLDPAAMEGVTKEMCEKGRLIPFDLIGSTLSVAMVNVLNRKALSSLEEAKECKVKAFNASWVDIKAVIKAYFDDGTANVLPESVGAGAVTEEQQEPAAPPPPAETAPEEPPSTPAAPQAAPPEPAPETPAQAPPQPSAQPPQAAPASQGAAPAGEEPSVAPFSGGKRGRKRRSKKRDSMRALKEQLMSESGVMKAPAGAPEAPGAEGPGIEVPSEEPPQPAAEEPPVPADTAVPPAAEAPVVPSSQSPSPAAPPKETPSPAAAASPEEQKQILMDKLVRPVKAEQWIEPLLAVKLRESGIKGAADHEVLDALPVGEKFARDVDEYMRTVQTLEALDDVVVDLEPEVKPSEPVPGVDEALEVKPLEEAPSAPVPEAQPVLEQQVPAPGEVEAATVVAPSEEVHVNVPQSEPVVDALPVSDEEKRSLLNTQDDREKRFRNRYLSAAAVEPIRVE